MAAFILIAIVFFATAVFTYSGEAFIVTKLRLKKGVTIGRHFQYKVFWALAIMIVVQWIKGVLISSSVVDSHGEIVYLVVEYFAVLLGLMFGKGVSRWAPGFFGRILAYANEVEQGRAHPFKDLRDKVTDTGADVAAETLKKTLTQPTQKTIGLPIQEAVIIKETSVEKKEDPLPLVKEEKFEDILDKFKKGN